MGSFMTKAVIAIAATLLLFAVQASATLSPVTQVLELMLTRVTLPSNQADALIVRGCVTCKPLSLKVSESTVYRIDGAKGAAMQLEPFRSSAGQLNRKGEALLIVKYLIATNTVSEVIVITERK